MKKIENHYQNHLKPKSLVADPLKDQPNNDPVLKIGQKQREAQAKKMLSRAKTFGKKG